MSAPLYIRPPSDTSRFSGIAGGVVTQPYFQSHFGLIKADGTADTKRTNDVSSNVVSVLQAGAFFGSLGSAPISAKIGRKWTLVLFSLVFSLGAVSPTFSHFPLFSEFFRTDFDYSSGWKKRAELHLRWTSNIRCWHRSHLRCRARICRRVLTEGCPGTNLRHFPDHGGHRCYDLIFHQL